MQRCLKYGNGEGMDDMLCDPTDPTGQRIIAASRDEIDAMLEAFDIDKRLPRIIYLRRRGTTYRLTACKIGIAESTVRKILAKCAPKLLQACGLRRK